MKVVDYYGVEIDPSELENLINLLCDDADEYKASDLTEKKIWQMTYHTAGIIDSELETMIYDHFEQWCDDHNVDINTSEGKVAFKLAWGGK